MRRTREREQNRKRRERERECEAVGEIEMTVLQQEKFGPVINLLIC